MAWRRPGDKPLYEPRMESLLTHIYASLGPNELTQDWYNKHPIVSDEMCITSYIHNEIDIFLSLR